MLLGRLGKMMSWEHSKLESGEIILEETPFNLSKISKEVLIVIRTDRCRTEYSDRVGEKEIIHRNLIGSPGYVKRVMMNILSNAMKYNRENGHIYISCIEIPSEQPEMTTMEFVCRDTGIGMGKEFLAHMFEPFTRNTERVEGTGLGLSITRGLVKLMDGTISVESRIHKGTTFKVELECEYADCGDGETGHPDPGHGGKCSGSGVCRPQVPDCGRQ